MITALDETRAALSPRLHPRRLRWPGLLISIGTMTLFGLLLAVAFTRMGLLSWSVGLVYIAYDTGLLIFVVVKSWPLRAASPPPAQRIGGDRIGGARQSLGVVIAAHNEAGTIAPTVAALLAQAEPPERIMIADDGSDDATPQTMLAAYGIAPPPLGEAADAADIPLRWLRVPRGGKARALNAAIVRLDTELILTIDADTLLDPGAIAAMRAAFAAEPGLVAATGVLRPICALSWRGRTYQWFQTYEYVRNFLSRYAWMRNDGLLLISGAFAGFRRDALVEVGGFDPDTMTEDYELIHRLHRFGVDRGRDWRVRVIGAARAVTDAPASLPAFLRQRRRWFAGFLQTQYWNRDMIGNARYGRLGLAMLPVKAMDTVQPLFGLSAFAILLALLGTGRLIVAWPVLAVMGVKIAVDLCFLLWSLRLYRHWTGEAPRAAPAILAAALEPFSFQLLRHLGAALGWWTVLSDNHVWGGQVRGGIQDRIGRDRIGAASSSEDFPVGDRSVASPPIASSNERLVR